MQGRVGARSPTILGDHIGLHVSARMMSWTMSWTLPPPLMTTTSMPVRTAIMAELMMLPTFPPGLG